MKLHDDLTRAQETAISQTETSHDNLRDAQVHLDLVLANAQGGREQDWATEVSRALLVVREALARHRHRVQGHSGLYAEIQNDAPWLKPRTDECSRQLLRLEQTAVDLQLDVDRVKGGEARAARGIRGDAERLLSSLKDLQAKENDLIFERFRDLPAAD